MYIYTFFQKFCHFYNFHISLFLLFMKSKIFDDECYMTYDANANCKAKVVKDDDNSDEDEQEEGELYGDGNIDD